jgi:hypothetical protein
MNDQIENLQIDNEILSAENNSLKRRLQAQEELNKNLNSRITELIEERDFAEKKIKDFLTRELYILKTKTFIDTVNIKDPELIPKLMVDRGYIAVLVYICETLYDKKRDKETADYVQKLINEGIDLYRQKAQNG